MNVALSHRTLFMYSADTDAPEILTSQSRAISNLAESARSVRYKS